jgi:hypothetical protein
LRKKALEPSDQRAFSVLDGGETVYIKVMDEESKEWICAHGALGTWEPKVRGKKPKAGDLIQRYGLLGEVEAHRLGLL